ncbi:MAG: hypothetical protein LBT31_10410 [Synergistaceae bacterium]|jgi:hypothetical protein|nr:hypothetical protein [Synergistaceae bacterium]
MKKTVTAILCLLILAALGYGLYAEGRNMTWSSESERIDAAPSWQELAASEAADAAPPILTAAVAERAKLPPLSAPDLSKPIEIKDKLFIQQCNEIYLNPMDYRGKAVKLEGIYDEFKDEATGELMRYVIRYGPGCCGNDGTAGFEFLYEGDVRPKQNDWIEVTGAVDLVPGNLGDEEYVVLASSKIRVMEKRGKEFVSN